MARAKESAVTIRHAEVGDAAAMATIDAEVLTPPWSWATFTELLGADRVLTRVALDPRDVIVGFACFQVVVDEAELQRIGVARSAQGAGVGRALLEAAWPTLADRGVDRCHLEVRADNAAALALYRRQGFEVVGQRRGYYRDPPGDAWMMARTIPPNSSTLACRGSGMGVC